MHEWKQECTHINDRNGQCAYYDGVCCTNEYPGGCFPIVEECRTAQIMKVQEKGSDGKEKEVDKRIPCSRIMSNKNEMCSVYINPAAIWNSSPCPFAGKMKTEVKQEKINPLKASKRAAGKKG